MRFYSPYFALSRRCRPIMPLGRVPNRERDVMEDGEGGLDVLSMVDVCARLLRAGYTEAQLVMTIQEVRATTFIAHMEIETPALSFSFFCF